MPDTKKERSLAFWDIESLSNVFMFAVYCPSTAIKDASGNDTLSPDILMFFYLFDDFTLTDSMKQNIEKAIFDKNKQLYPQNTVIQYLDLKEEEVNKMMLNMFCVDNKSAFGKPEENMFRYINPKLNTDLDLSNNVPYMIGYNTANYDCTMMAFYFNETWGFDTQGRASFMPTTAGYMRKFNNTLFEAYRDNMSCALKNTEANIYQNMLRAGIYIDAAKVNDKVYKMPLKRIMGMLGMDIFEDDIVKGNAPVKTLEEICKLFAYNASDCIKLAKLFEHRAYKAQYQLKKGLIEAYPDLIYNSKNEVRVNRLKIDDTSAKFAARVLCPDGFLPDIRAVSFEYPKGSGRNVLTETWEWAREKFKDHPEVMTNYLDPIFQYYRNIEGKNYDDSEHYDQTYVLDGLPAESVKNIPWPCTCTPYFNADGTPSCTYVNFGIGGIHGAEYNQKKYLQDLAEAQAHDAEINAFVSHFTEEELKQLKTTVTIDGEKYKVSKYITKKKDGSIRIKYAKPVELFQKDKKTGMWSLNKKYVYCSDDEVDHEDFTSYYPCMLMNLKAYENKALGKDRYVEQFNNKTLYGKYMKDEARPKAEQEFYKTLREGTKLILNSASGASDTAYDNNIRMNNVIISMRIIGQLFTWRIGQAQTLEGYKITSTNTDGLYAVCNDETRARCREILERESASIGVDIEPEEMRLVSKDANNRIEISLNPNKKGLDRILSAGGGDTACFDGPVPTKALSHPAVVDTLLVAYLLEYGVNEPFDTVKAMNILKEIKDTYDPLKLLILYQQIINSSEGSVRYIFGMVGDQIRTFQHNNRIFAIKSEAAHLYIANGNNLYEGHDELADKVLTEYGVNINEFKNTRIVKIPRIPPTQNMLIYNNALDELPPETMKGFIDNIDDGFYIDLLENAYSNWCNAESGKTNDAEDASEIVTEEAE